MKLYRVFSEEGERFVVATTFGGAVLRWRGQMLNTYGLDDGGPSGSGWTHQSEPQTVELMSEEAPIGIFDDKYAIGIERGMIQDGRALVIERRGAEHSTFFVPADSIVPPETVSRVVLGPEDTLSLGPPREAQP